MTLGKGSEARGQRKILPTITDLFTLSLLIP